MSIAPTFGRGKPDGSVEGGDSPSAGPAPVALVSPRRQDRHAVDPIVVPRPDRGPRLAPYLALVPALFVGLLVGWLLDVAGPMLVPTVVVAAWAVAASRSRVRTTVLPGWASIDLVKLAGSLLVGVGVLTVVGTFFDLTMTTAQLAVVAVVPAVAVPSRWLVLRQTRRPSKVLVLGDASAIAMAKTLRKAGELEIVTALGVGQLDDVEWSRGAADGDEVEQDFPIAPLTSLADVAGKVSALGVDTVLVFTSARLDEVRLRELTWMLERSGCRLLLAGLPWGTSAHRVSAARVSGLTAVEVAPSRPGRAQHGGKVMLDRLAGAALMAMAAPVLAVCAVAIRSESNGSPIFRQVRIGRDGVPFTMYKLRTMYVDAGERLAALEAGNEGNGLLFKLKHDPRVTRTGRLLRKLSLDELPQLINVVRGEMALVGPRPALPSEVANYDELLWRRLAVRPGMTGLWQVSGRSDLSLEDSLRLDLEYVDNWTVGGDLAIGARTVGAVVSARGAY